MIHALLKLSGHCVLITDKDVVQRDSGKHRPAPVKVSYPAACFAGKLGAPLGFGRATRIIPYHTLSLTSTNQPRCYKYA